MKMTAFRYWLTATWLITGSSMADDDCLLVALDQINTSANELAITSGPQSGQFIFEHRGGEWGQRGFSSQLLIYDCQSKKIESLTLAGLIDAGDPYFDKATNTLWLTSQGESADSKTGADIFSVRFTDSGWTQPIRLPAPVNSPADEYSPIPRAGKIYFASGRGGDGNLYVAEQIDAGWQVDALSSVLNAETGEWNLWLSLDEQRVIFEASGRPQNITVSGDLYVSQLEQGGDWLLPVPLRITNAIGSQLNPRKVGNRLVYASSAGRNHTDLVIVHFDEVISTLRER